MCGDPLVKGVNLRPAPVAENRGDFCLVAKFSFIFDEYAYIVLYLQVLLPVSIPYSERKLEIMT